MPKRYRKRDKQQSTLILWIILAVVGVGGGSVGIYFLVKGSGKKTSATEEPPGLGLAVLDQDNVANTRSWAADQVKRLKDVAARKNDAALKDEISRVENELKSSLLGKKVRWAFPVAAVVDGEVKLDTFFGIEAGRFPGDDPGLGGRPMRRLYFRAYFDGDNDVVHVGNDVSADEARRLRKGNTLTIVRTVTEVMLTQHDEKWVSTSAYSKVVDVMEPYCITVVLSRK
jgi:hypothetical protein